MIELITLRDKDKTKLIEGVLLYPLKVNRDKSGILVETLRKDWKDIYGANREFAMQYYSVTRSGIARDEDVWHYHPNIQEDRFLVAQGAIVTAVADNRRDSPTYGYLNLFYMQADKDPYILLIPRQTLHGFLVISKNPAVLLNFPTTLYNKKEEGRIPYAQAQVKLPDGSLFSWSKVRHKFSNEEN